MRHRPVGEEGRLEGRRGEIGWEAVPGMLMGGAPLAMEMGPLSREWSQWMGRLARQMRR